MNAQFFVAGRDDVDAILEMQQEFYGIGNNRDSAREVLRTLIDNALFGKVWLIMIDGKVSGYAILTLGYSFELKGKNAYLEELYLKPPFRDQGIEARVIDFLAIQSKTMGVQAIHLQVDAHNEKNILLYHNYGFHNQNRTLMTRPV